MTRHSGTTHLSQFSCYWAQTIPDQPAVVSNDQPISWRELDGQANTVANYLAQQGVSAGDRIGCLLENCAKYYALIIGCWKVGAVFVPLNPRFGDYELKAIIDDADFALIFATAELYQRVAQTDVGESGILAFPSNANSQPLSTIFTGDREFDDASIDGSQSGLIVYTSGTTGIPKGVVFSAERLFQLAFSVSRYANCTADDRFLLLAPLAFGGGILVNLLNAYVAGSALYIENDFDPGRALKLIRDEGISVFIAVPLIWQYLSMHPDFADSDLGNLKFAVSGGAPVPLPLLELFQSKGVSIQQAYGCTELGGFISILPRHLTLEKPGSCGVAGIGCTLEIQDDQGNALPAGEVGEIMIAGSQGFEGYYNKPEASAESMREGWFASGDLGYIDEQGLLYITDRKKNMIISGGVNVYPAEVERALLTLDGIDNVAVLGSPSERWGEEVVAIVSSAEALDPEALRRQAQPLLGDFKTPKRFVITSAPFPLTPSGKIARGDKLSDFLEQLDSASE